MNIENNEDYNQLLNQNQENLQLQQQIASMENVVKQHLSREALSRFGNIKSAHPKKTLSIIAIVYQLIQQKIIQGKLNDEEFKDILKNIPKEEQNFTIKRK